MSHGRNTVNSTNSFLPSYTLPRQTADSDSIPTPASITAYKYR